MGEKMKIGYIDCVENKKDVYQAVRKIFDELVADSEFDKKTAPEIEKIPIVAKMVLKKNDIAFIFLSEDEENAERIKQVKNKLMDVECDSEKFVVVCTDEKEIEKKIKTTITFIFSPEKLEEMIGK